MKPKIFTLNKVVPQYNQGVERQTTRTLRN